MEDFSVQFSQSGKEHVLTLPDEQLLFASRKHPFVVILPIIGTLLASSFTIGIIFYLSSLLRIGMLFGLGINVLILLLAVHIVVKLFIDWYFHIFILTTGKIMELCYKPLYGEKINEVLLDQVRCTEIDAEINGIVNQFLDIGDISFTFDRPTHQQEFIFSNMSSPKAIQHMLSKLLNATKKDVSFSHHLPVWYQGERAKRPFRFIEEIIPRQSLQVI